MDAIFKALNDAVRREILDCLREDDGQSLADLEARFEMTRFGVMKHLKVLEDANLITTRKAGRFKYHYLNALPLQEAIDRWIDPFRAKPAARAVIDLKSKLEGTAQMPLDTKPDFVMQTFIRCTKDALWDALTNPDQVIHYHFMATSAKGHLTDEGQATYYAGPAEMLVIKTLSSNPKDRLEMGFEPKWAPDMAASRCVYVIAEEGPNCSLTIEHYDIPAGQEGVADGWVRLAAGLKTYLETGQPSRFGMEQGQ